MDEVLLAVESSDALVARLMAFCSRGEAVQGEAGEVETHDVDAEEGESKLAAFVRRNADSFRGVEADEEHGHQVHNLFRRYEELFEDVVEGFLREEELTPDEFFAHCRALQRSSKHEDATGNLQLLLSALDFEAFCELMTQEAIQTQLALKAAEDMGL